MEGKGDRRGRDGRGRDGRGRDGKVCGGHEVMPIAHFGRVHSLK